MTPQAIHQTPKHVLRAQASRLSAVLLVAAAMAVLPLRTAGAACGAVPSTYPTTAGTLNLGGSALLNGGGISGTGNSLQTNGSLTNASPSLPSLSPATFPTFSAAVNTSGPTIAAGTWNVVTAGTGDTFSGGTYYINTLNASGTVTFAPGTYYVSTMTLANSTDFQISPAGVVQIYLNNSITTTRTGVHFNTTGAGSSSVNNFQLFLYSSANFRVGNTFAMNGLIYAPDVGSGNRIQVEDNATISGALITAGTIVTGGDPHFTSSAAIRTAIGSISTCGTTSVDHYELSLPTTSVACATTTVTVTACTDTSSPCTNAYTSASGTTATLATSGATLASGTVTFNASGVATTTLSYPAAANGTSVSVTLSGEQTVATNSRKCCANGTSCSTANSCSTTFNTAGFIFSAAADGVSATIPSQVAGTLSSTYYLRAVQTNTSTKACEAALSGSNTVNFGYECNNPTTCSNSNLMTVTGNAAATTISRNNNGSVASYTSVGMTFDSNGNAPFTFRYNDAGQVKLYATKAASGALLSSLSGSTNAFVTKPGGFVLSSIQQTAAPQLVNPAATTATGTKFVKAGESFTATITATTSTGATTPNFGRETSPEGVLLTPAVVTGLGLTSNGTMGNGTVSGASFSSGVATVTNLSWSEVGIMRLTPSIGDADYLGAGDVTGTTTGNIGRFVLDHFELTTTGSNAPRLTNRSGLASCYPLTTGTMLLGSTTLTVASASGLAVADSVVVWGAGASGGDLTATISAISGLSVTLGTAAGTAVATTPVRKNGFSYYTEPMTAAFRLLARNLGGTTTANYAGAWAKLDPATPSLFGFGAVNSATNLTTRLSATSIAGSWATGVLDATATLSFSRAASVDGPYDALDVGIAPSDSDSAAMGSFDLNVAGSNDHARLGRTKVRFGRLRVSNAIGSTLLDLPIPLVVQYYSTYGFVTNTDDSCTTLAGTDFALSNFKVNLTGPATCDTSVSPSTTITFAAGVPSPTTRLVLTKPGSGNNGSVDISPNLAAAAGTTCSANTGISATVSSRSYLQFNWDGGATFDKNPSGRATFGVYRNAGEFIHYRENY